MLMVNTFILCDDATVTATYLDNKRLGKQRVEAKQIIDTLEGKNSGWINHPAVRMWQGYVNGLKDYFNKIVAEWVKRGYTNNMELFVIEGDIIYPSWYFNKKVHYSHMSRLIEKDAEHYSHLSPPVEYLSYGYIWPGKWTAEELETLSVDKLGEPFVPIVICSAFTSKGDKCKSKAIHDGKCGMHRDKNYVHPVCVAIKPSGQKCMNKAIDGCVCGVHRNYKLKLIN
jgi:hypothetical protein